jgi:rhamnogalacturonyl hydrolase YesR
MPLIQECLYIALEATEDEKFSDIIKELMYQLEQAEMSSDNIGSVRFICGFENRKIN